MTAPSRDQVLAWAAAGTPLAVSLAGNVTWGWTTGSPILIVAGIVTPLLLVLSIERWRSMPPATGRQWWVRTLAMTGVVIVVAGWSWLHTAALLLAEVAKLHPGPSPSLVETIMRVAETVLCAAAPLAIDGLAVLSVLALDGSATGRSTGEGGPDRTGGRPPDRSETGPDRRTDAELLDVLRATDPVPTSRNAVMRTVPVGTGRADRLLTELATTPDRTGSTNGHAVGARG